MRILSLSLENFKNIKKYELSTGGHNVDIYGDNGVGKTTLADAYFWLLFGKDSAGRSDSNFDIIPLGTSGLDCSVKGIFRKENGEELSLRRVYKQVFARKNGEAEREYKGNTTDFYIDDVPKPKKDYTAFVSEICDESTLMLLSDPDRFPGKMKWDERRGILIKMFSEQTDDRKIILAHKELAPLLELIGLKSVDDYAAITRERRKAINRELAEVPGRIDEAEKAKPADAVPLPADGPRLGQLTVEKNTLEDKISQLRSGESAANLRKEIAELETKMANSKVEYIRTSSRQTNSNELSRLRSELSRIALGTDDRKFKLKRLNAQLKELDEQLPKLRQDCIDNFNAEFNESEGICPTCGQAYPEEKTDELRTAFNQKKADRQEAMESKGKQLKTERDNTADDIQAEQSALESDQKQIEELYEQIKALESQISEPIPFESTPAFETMSSSLKEKQQQLFDLDKTIGFQISRTREKLQDVEKEISDINSRFANKGLLERQDARIKQLKADEKKLAIELAQIDNGLRLADEFVQTKASNIEDGINHAFRIVKWKLFDRQINGGIKACCEATVDGVGYNTNLNSSAKLNAGLDIISALSAKMGVSLPIWIDNAESVTSFLPTDSQVIRLFVSAADKQLRAVVRE